ncbi:similar to 1110008L16Rik protein (predicted) [Rattus norvegicus]|uniref:Mitochondrial ribonuclease P catalytic subunit n=2 Tax=Rattus norvegicus TaxID=10116 RepID=MRPP3_RAT|nr:mitochondrial ribonuclease P catalytic subunit precursor [Rattus norvegicus]B5DF07.1 RecName: Full=Mitochondrial ribonuclease P catalytic subunit; AltName: Full=Mitochondrial ribonuclease P protein 3; Short=Mitochondrial RNase P protein 3; Flags: Precursor [Rattus norvegicus]AAI68878.1 Similar to 1110008L16Rik protein [Rattus norvegicus]EDM03424.1 similar to 1110008L16Rik protein (predicted) [Rattus norvegicus]|eukprot:NP_001100200.1 mitochondrial ribonuclease P protein 3 precursor [Rattus norvegicus]
MTFYLSGFRSFLKLWKSNPYFELGPATSSASFFLGVHCVIGNQQRWFSVKPTTPPNSKILNLLVTKARTLKKGNDSNKQASSGPHYFAAGEAKKRSHLSGNPQNQGHTLPVKSTVQLPTKPLNSEEWDKLKEDFKGKASFEDFVISQMTRSCSSVDVAKSLLAWVAAKNNGIVGYNLLVKYLYLCVFHKQTSEVIDVYEIMKAKYKSLESGGYTLLIRGLIHSDRWREALLLLEDIKKVMVPSKKNYGDCIQGALLHQDVNVAWSLYQELVGHNLIPLLETLKAFFDHGKDMNDDQYSNQLLDILLYLRNNQLYPGESFAHSIKTWFESIPGRQWKGQFTTIQKSGQCSSCGRAIESIHLSPEEYEFLKETIMRDVIDGGDQYKKTTPQELKRFERFVKSCPPFDIVIDGLNVAKMFPKGRESQNLLGIVSQLAQQNLQLLVLGRKHMLRPSSQWRKDEMEQVRKQAHCFFADNISEDDPFLLYATLNSGSHCKFITKDLLRDHKACLPDARAQRLFFKWQQGHQLAITKGFLKSKLTFQHILSYDTVVQTTGDTWHIPYDEDLVPRSSCEVPTKWLCLQRKTPAPC